MFRRLLGRAAPARTVTPESPHSQPDPGFDALPRFSRLAAELAAAARATAARPPWKEGRLFFFDRRRQAEVEASRPAASAKPLPELSDLIHAELPLLFASAELRHVARAVSGLTSAAGALAPFCPAARELADLLAAPDDEAFVVLHPARRVGVRVAVTGVADVGEFHLLLAGAAPEFGAGVRPAAGGEGSVSEARFQTYTYRALRPDGSLPDGFGGCDHWLWPHAPLASVPRVGRDRVVLLGPPAFRQAWEATRRFPAVPAAVRLIDTLNPFRCAEYLAKLVGRPVEPVPVVVEPKPARAA